MGFEDSADTIFAPATVAGRSAVAVVRVSGPAAGLVCQRLTNRPPPPARMASLRALLDPRDGASFDQALVIWFPGPGSVTGEDVLELQVHGSPAVVTILLTSLADIPGVRPAEAGEFTKRAFMRGRLDLTAVEGLADLIAAETRAQARQALRQLEGALGRLYEGWRERTLAALARIEAEIDFAAEEEVADDLVTVVRPELERVAAEIAAHLAGGGRGERVRAGVVIAVVGAPNVGKSSLVNTLARRDVAIVAATPGTTRDVLEVRMDLGGYAVTLLDSAGLRETNDEVEAEGVRRARARAAAADLRVIVVDGAAWPRVERPELALLDRDCLVVVNKSDLARIPERVDVGGRPAIRLSCWTGEGIEALLDALGERVAGLVSGDDAPQLSRARHRAALNDAAGALGSFLRAGDQLEVAMKAEDLRQAARALGRITGRFEVEELLDRVFAEFCIGK